MKFKRASQKALARELVRAREDWFHGITWRADASPPGETGAEPIGRWLIFADERGVAAGLERRLTAGGAACHVVRWSDGADPGVVLRELATAGPAPQAVLYLWGLEAGVDTQERVLGGVLRLVDALVGGGRSNTPLWFVTQRAHQIDDGDAVAAWQAPLWGLGRVAQTEHPELGCRLVDLGTAEGAELDALGLLLTAPSGEAQLVLRGGRRMVARLARTRASRRLTVPDAESYRLAIGVPGELRNLALEPAGRRAPGRGELEIAVEATGLIFRDVLTALGMYPGETLPLGGECAGRVVAVGEAVQGLAVGDEVMALVPGSFSRYVTLDARLAARKPANLGFVEAAGVPSAFMTAWYGLFDLGGLKAGERVLVHAAAGGVGMAAVQLARRAGAEVFATASPQKWAAVRALGVEHVMSSRTLDFGAEIAALTGGRGVDVVLNSLAGEFIDTSVAALAEGGRFIEMGKRDLRVAHELAPGRRVSYQAFDLMKVAPDRLGELLRATGEAIERGELAPLPVATFELAGATDAFRTMATARHIGKIVVRAPSAGDPVSIRGDGTYLVTGGLGGLGLEVARWLVARGARHLVLAGRRPPGEEARAEIARMEEAGARILTRQVDVAVRAQVASLLDEVRGVAPPLRGVAHLAGALDPCALAQQSWERFERVLGPKATGAWTLHELTAGADLDFFVLVGTVAAVLGTAGHGSTAAASAFLDALASERAASGLPALAMCLGPVADVGLARTEAGRLLEDRLRRTGIDPLTPGQVVAALEELLRGGAVEAVVMRLDAERLAASAPGGGPGMLSDLAAGTRTAARRAKEAGLAEQVAALAEAERHDWLVAYVRAIVAEKVGLEKVDGVDVRRPLRDLGVDSLQMIEVRNALSGALGETLPATLGFDYPTVEAIAGYLQGRMAPEAPAVPKVPREEIEAFVTALREAPEGRLEQLGLLEGLRRLVATQAGAAAGEATRAPSERLESDLHSASHEDLLALIGQELDGVE